MGGAAPGGPASTSIRIEYDVRVPLRDGATLSADIYRPKGEDKVPVILVRTPYDNGAAAHVAAGKHWASKGYAYVVQDVRGRGESDGEFYPLVTEGDDGDDTIEWLARQTRRPLRRSPRESVGSRRRDWRAPERTESPFRPKRPGSLGLVSIWTQLLPDCYRSAREAVVLAETGRDQRLPASNGDSASGFRARVACRRAARAV